jgi:hypothetical protein
MMEAFLRAKPEGRAAPKAIVESPALFPFNVQPPGSSAVAFNARLDIARHGLDDELVLLRSDAASP